MSQDDFARAIREAGERAGQPNDASKRLVQRWEAGTTAAPRPVYARALEAVTGMPIETLGFASAVPQARVSDDGRGGHDVESAPAGVAAPSGNRTAQPAPHGNHSGVWLSRYEYFSSGRNDAFTQLHYVVVLQHGNRLTVRSLPKSANSSLGIDLTLDGNVVTGTWTETTAPNSYIRETARRRGLQK